MNNFLAPKERKNVANNNIYATNLQISLGTQYHRIMSSLKISRAVLTFLALLVIISVVVVFFFSAAKKTTNSSTQLNIVAGEDFWGSLASQLGGSKVNVTSIVTDPNSDPHEYESNTANAREFASANLVILNGAGYDSWGDKLLSASPNPKQKVLNVASLLGKKNGDNPHFWYSPSYVNQVISKIEEDLIGLAPNNSNYFKARYSSLKSNLAAYQERISTIKKQFAGVKVASTEDIFVYLSQAIGLDLISPPAFMEAVAEGNDPPANSVVQFQQQLESGQVKLLVYNTQTITPLTDSIKKLAIAKHIPIVGVSETIEPPNLSFQDWMNNILSEIQKALAKSVVSSKQ